MPVPKSVVVITFTTPTPSPTPTPAFNSESCAYRVLSITFSYKNSYMPIDMYYSKVL